MEKKFFIRQADNTVLGPFDRATVLSWVQNGDLTLDTGISFDKQSWQSLQEALDLIIPEAETEMPVPDSEEPPQAPAAVISENAALHGQSGKIEQTAKLDRSFIRIFADTLSALGNSSVYLQKILRKGPNAMLISAVTAVFIALGAVLLGGGLFAERYNLPALQTILRTSISVILGGGSFWLLNTIIRLCCSRPAKDAAEADFLAAMYGMMNLAVMLLIFNASLFIFNTDLYAVSIQHKLILLSAALPIALFFLFNALLALRVNFMYNAKLFSPAASLAAIAEIEIVSIMIIFIQHPIYM